MTTPRLSGPLTIADVAALIGRPYEYTRRTLHSMNDARAGRLLNCVNPRAKRKTYTTTRSQLKAAAPEWFIDTRMLGEQVAELSADVKDVGRRMNECERAVGGLHRRMSKARLPL